MTERKIKSVKTAEIINFVESKNIGRLTSCWLVASFAENQGDYVLACRRALHYGVPDKILVALHSHLITCFPDHDGFIEWEH